MTFNFPMEILEIIRNTNAMLYLANSYCMVIIYFFYIIQMGNKAKKWGKGSLNRLKYRELRKTVK